MKSMHDATARRIMNCTQILAGITVAFLPALLPALLLTLQLAQPASAHAQQPDIKAADLTPLAEIYQTIYLSNLTQPYDLNEVQSALRNMLPKAKLYGIPSQNAIAVRGTAEDVQLAQKICADLDRPKKVYRLTFSIHDAEDVQHADAHRFTLVVASGAKTVFKQGSKVPIATGTNDAASSTQNSQVSYQDVGLSIEASVDAYADGGLRLRSKVEQSDVSADKSGFSLQDPILRQTVVDATASLTPGKPFVLGSIYVPGNTRQQEIEVVADLVH